MNIINKQIDLPKNENEQFILTKEAIEILKKEGNIVARFTPDGDINNCFVRKCLREKVMGEWVDIHVDMPINVSTYEDKQKFCGHYSHHGDAIDPMVYSMKEGDVLVFSVWADGWRNDYIKDAGLHADVLYWKLVKKNGKFLKSHFAHSISPDNSARITNVF